MQSPLAHSANLLVAVCHSAAFNAGWWTNLKTGENLVQTQGFNVPEKLCLIHSEISEAMEGHRKNLPDDKLPHRKWSKSNWPMR